MTDKGAPINEPYHIQNCLDQINKTYHLLTLGDAQPRLDNYHLSGLMEVILLRMEDVLYVNSESKACIKAHNHFVRSLYWLRLHWDEEFNKKEK